MDIVYLKYVGEKPVKRDTVCNSGIIWAGHGDVQPVPAKIAGILLQHRDVWQRHNAGEAHSAPIADPNLNAPTTEGEEEEVPQSVTLGLTPPAPTVPSISPNPEEAGNTGEGKETGPDGENASNPAPEADSTDKHAVLVDLLRNMPRDEEHISQKGRPIIAKVRELSGNPDLTVQELAAAWDQVDG